MNRGNSNQTPLGAGTMSSIPYTGSLNGTSNGVYGTHPGLHALIK